MPSREQLFVTSVKRLLALLDSHEIVKRFKTDWTVSYHEGVRLEDQVELVRSRLTEVERSA